MGRPRKKDEIPYKIWNGAEGWQCMVPVGVKRNGRPDRRKVRGKDEQDVKNKVLELIAQVKKNRVPKPNTRWKLGAWLLHWLATEDDLRYLSTKTYGWAVHKHLIPGLGEWRLKALVHQADLLKEFFKGLDKTKTEGAPLKPVSVHSVYRTLRAALNDAVKAKIIGHSPLDDIDPKDRPKFDNVEFDPHTIEEARRIIAVCDRRRNGTRWTVGATVGLRQREALGLPWVVPVHTTRDKPIGLDAVTGFIDVRRQAVRKTLEHGCNSPVECARRHCRTSPCQPPWVHGCEDPTRCYGQAWRCKQREPGKCRVHRRDTCPAVCPPGCTGHARGCPNKIGGIVYEDVKSKKGRRRMAIPQPMWDRILIHQQQQDVEREHAGDMWEENGLVWCQQNGRPIDTSMDRKEWIEIQQEAKVRRGRIHDERHLAATILLLMEVPDSVVMEIMGWSDRRMLARYQHIIDEMREEAAKRVGGLLFPAAPEPGPQPTKEEPDEPKAGNVVWMDKFKQRRAGQ